MTRRKQPRKKAAELKLVEEDRPDTEVAEKARRRTFTAVYKARILAEVDAARPGTVASILRWEGLYSSHLTIWRGE
ncbi:MAG: hypothetical protein K2Z81_19555 [Cyanobacteria bacterium]|nr:hypothetical protein [Cyanobacteriota bacterium]